MHSLELTHHTVQMLMPVELRDRDLERGRIVILEFHRLPLSCALQNKQWINSDGRHVTPVTAPTLTLTVSLAHAVFNKPR